MNDGHHEGKENPADESILLFGGLAKPEDVSELAPKEVMKIIETPCWNCQMSMRLAFVDDTVGVHEFDADQIEIARAHGVKIEERHSKELGETYMANICPHCDEMYGMLLLSHVWNEPSVEEVILPSASAEPSSD